MSRPAVGWWRSGGVMCGIRKQQQIFAAGFLFPINSCYGSLTACQLSTYEMSATRTTPSAPRPLPQPHNHPRPRPHPHQRSATRTTPSAPRAWLAGPCGSTTHSCTTSCPSCWRTRSSSPSNGTFLTLSLPPTDRRLRRSPFDPVVGPFERCVDADRQT